MEKKNWIPLLLVIMFFWALMHPLSKMIVGDVPTFLLTSLRFGLGTVTVFAYLILTKKKIKVDKEDIIPLGIIGIIGNGIPTALYFIGLKMTTATNASILLNMSPLLIAILSPLLIGEKLKKMQTFGVVLGFLGMMVVVANGLDFTNILSSEYFYGNLIIVSGTIGIALYTIYGKKYVQKYGGFVASSYGILAAAILMLLASIATGEIGAITTLNSMDWFVIVYLGVLIAGFIYGIWYSSLKVLGPTKASSFKLLIPVYATIVAIILLGEMPNLMTIVGGGLVIVGLYFTHDIDLFDL
jgi:drug/metabolite transporter (DMT)-like permease